MSSAKVVLATKNPGKLRELKEMAEGAISFDLILAPAQFDPEETGSTFEENAIIKATVAGDMTGNISVADDSGIVVDALGGRPGIYSARYSEGDEALGRRKLLNEMKEVPEGKRQAAFVCAMAVYDPASRSIIYKVECSWKGRLSFEERGQGGFGFDPIFLLADQDVTSAQLSSSDKNLKSHRGQAWRKVLEFLEKTFIPA